MPVPRVLFVSPFVPYPRVDVADDPIDFFYYRNTMGQGLFQLRQSHSWHPLHYLAQNLPVPSTVLENPTWRGFQDEVDHGGYDLVALTFTVPTTGRILRMVTWIKETYPEIQVVVGGYGTAIFGERFGPEQDLASRVDGICTGEGLAWMRDFLASRWGVTGEMPHTQDLVPTRNGLLRSHVSLYRQAAVVRSLGCRNGCAFCATSNHFGCRRIPVLDGEGLYDQLRAAALRHPDIQSAIVYDENLLDDRDEVLRFLAKVEHDPLFHERPFLLTVFSSVQAVSRFTVEELLLCGIGTIFVGIESFDEAILADEGLGKRSGGSVAGLFDALHAAGIHTLASTIVGWDGHTREKATQDLDRFVALNPTFYQVVPLHLVPGTPLWRRMRDAGRLVDGYRYDDDGISRSNFRYLHLTDTEAQGLVHGTYRRLVEEGGPWPFRIAENLHRGWKTLRDHADPVLAARARGNLRMLRSTLPLAVVSGLLFGGAGFRRRWWAWMRAILADLPVLTSLCVLLSPLVLLALFGLRMEGWIRFHLSADGDQPESRRRPSPGDLPHGHGSPTLP